MNTNQKYKYIFITFVVAILGMLSYLLVNPGSTVGVASSSTSVYEQRPVHSRDGIGKVYMGREIAQVMGHLAAGWLERPTREAEEQPTKLIKALNLKPNDVVADIGAGTGFFGFRIAPLLTSGKVLAVDIQPEMLNIIDSIKKEKHITNVESVLGSESNPNLPPESVDLALMVDAYHEFSYPKEMIQGITRSALRRSASLSLKPGGRVVLVEYRGENPFIMIKPLHKMTQKQARKEMQAAGLVWRETNNVLPQQHIMIFQKPV
ncbi:class I SAM-dependent methyltransferase [Aetokthonos hydrillicola Thurmond2011]|jgi:ubiquinone/menaquinone biosynthesis C-methylase UbiE|uniref:Class I SAM-dependent methyltransferase n=1 Tax=Aetokthonos hydrillicola Thurmond2011 TaxID=2712845 RepID=A0AAP5M8Z8_9CYAN|nr:class I SAM-dependent methyltransferase [Aetokthonos hydrillicola]MBO3461536.1 class I SAM-dependent methyltransferase [Aetokthonos hydrillicola CCALA 1050]MBW4584674.1 class I SAM-dependent methyltransferase [Aetokthonos hydrillicola CCALA 1050]MDR9895217.1 class I SAM-dependent methyltransferase [Aetokthonos hydrillicola Thurmond2011]